jgi:hypothetical protein
MKKNKRVKKERKKGERRKKNEPPPPPTAPTDCHIGYLDSCHYNISSLEKQHYNLYILKFAITILSLPDSYHFLRRPSIWAHTSDLICIRMPVFGQKNTSIASLPRAIASSSTSSHLSRRMVSTRWEGQSDTKLPTCGPPRL